MQTKWADLTIISSTKLDYAKLIKTYEKIGFKQLSTALGKHMAKDHLFKSSLCYLANEDLIGCKRALENYVLEDPTFETDRKKKFLNSILTCCE